MTEPTPMPGRPLTEEERQELFKSGELPTSFTPEQPEPEKEQQGGFDVGQALQTGYNFLTENLNESAGQTREEREERFRSQIQQSDKDNPDPVRNFTENLAVSAVDFIDNTFQGDQRTREEITQNRQQIGLDNRARMAALNEEVTSQNDFTGEATRAVVGGVAQSLEGVLEAGDFIGDVGLTLLAGSGLDFGLVQDKDLTWHEDYIAMDYDFGVAPNNTRLGNFARNTIGVVLNMRQLAMYGGAKLPILRAGMGPNSTWATRLGGDQMRGFLVDFFTNPGEGNLSNMLGGDQENSFILLKALAHEDEDNQYIRRLKNGIEGGIIGTASDALGEFYGALRKGYKSRMSGKSPEEATKQTIAETKRLAEAEAKTYEWDESLLDVLESGEDGYEDALKAWNGLSYQDKTYIYEDLPRERQLALRNIRPIGYTVNNQMDRARWGVDLGYGNKARYSFERLEDSTKAIDVTWELDNDTIQRLKDNPELRLNLLPIRSEFRKIVKEGHFRVGQILEATPAADSYGFGRNRSEARNRATEQRYNDSSFEKTLASAPPEMQEQIYAAARENFGLLGESFDDAPYSSGRDSVVPDQVSFLKEAYNRLMPNRWEAEIHLKGGSNQRARIYEMMGFSKPASDQQQRAIVVQTPNGLTVKPFEGPGFDWDNPQPYFDAAEAASAAARANAETVNLRLYHGTTDSNAKSIRANGFRLSTRTDRGGVGNALGDGLYFTSNKAYAGDYGRNVLEGAGTDVRLKTITQDELEQIVDRYGGFDENMFLVDDQALIKEFGEEYDGVRVKDAVFGGLGDTVGDEIVIFDPKVADELVKDSPVDTVDVQARKAENKINGTRDGKEGQLDPQERAARTSRFDVDEVEVTQQTWTDPDGSPKPFLDNDLINRLDTVEKITNYIKIHDKHINVDEIAKRLRRERVEYQMDILRTVARMATAGVEERFLDEISYYVDPKVRVDQGDFMRKNVEVGGAVVLKVMAKDVAVQMKELASEMLELQELDANYNTQALMILERAELLLRLKKQSTQSSSDFLQQWGLKPRQQYDKAQANDAQIAQIFAEWKEKFREADVAEIRDIQQDFKDFASSLILTDGDPIRQLSYWQAWVKSGFQSFNQVIINGMLSTPVSQMRNIGGNIATVAGRPVAQALGALMRSDELSRTQGYAMAKSSLMMFESMHETIFEALRVARKSWQQKVAVTDASKIDYAEADAAKMDALVAKAKTPLQRQAAQILQAYHNFAHSPWTALPSRALTAADDFFKTMAVRQDLRYQAAMEAENFDLDFSPLKNKKDARSQIYHQLVDQNLGLNGEILSQRLRDVADDVTFQTELQDGMVKNLSEFAIDNPALKQFLPFVKTPHNLNIYAGQHIPIPGVDRFIKESQDIIKSGTPEQRAILRGRKALGFMMFTTGSTLTHAGLLTGYGPQDPELRAIWLKTHQPMSIKIGNNWYSYKAIPVADFIFPAIADTAMILKSLGDYEGNQLGQQLIYSIASIAANRTYFSGLVELAGLLDFESYNFGTATSDFILDRMNMMAGMSGLRGGLENIHKEGVTVYRSNLDATMGKLTGGFLGERIEVTDILTGEQQIRGFEHPVNFVSPFRVMTPNAHELTTFFGDPRVRFEMPTDITERIDGLQLTEDEQEFLRQAMYANGDLAYELEEYAFGPRFAQDHKNWTDALGTSDGTPRKDSVWYKRLRSIFLSRRRLAIRALEEDDTALGRHFRERMTEHQLKQQNPNARTFGPGRSENAVQQLSTFAN